MTLTAESCRWLAVMLGLADRQDEQPFKEVRMRVSTANAWRSAWFAAIVMGIFGATAAQAQKETRKDAFQHFSFRVEIEGVDVGFFRSVSGLTIEAEVIEFREGGSDVIRKLPGVRKYPNLVLKRGFTGSPALYDWFNSVSRGNAAKVDGSIVMLSPNLTEIARWQFHNGFPANERAPTSTRRQTTSRSRRSRSRTKG
jgi:phage tail-like protein